MWIAENSDTTLAMIKNINDRRKGKNVNTFDFSTLYTKIPLEDLKMKLKKVVDKAFKGGQNQYVIITKYQANWSNKKNKDTLEIALAPI